MRQSKFERLIGGMGQAIAHGWRDRSFVILGNPDRWAARGFVKVCLTEQETGSTKPTQ